MRQSLADALEHHSTVDMRLTAEAPTIVVPMQAQRRRQEFMGYRVGRACMEQSNEGTEESSKGTE